MNKKKVIICIICGFLLLCCFAGSIYLKKVSNYKQAIKKTEISEIDFTKLADGIYIGEYDVDFISAKVEVHIKDGKIDELKLIEHKNDKGTPAEVIIDHMVNEQRIDVDAISGATNSSTVIKKAVENALTE